MEQPLYYWVPSIGPSGFAFLDSKRYKKWNGSLLVGSLKFQYLERLVLNKKTKLLTGKKLLIQLVELEMLKLVLMDTFTLELKTRGYSN